MSNISEIENSNYFTVFPNPATNELNIDAELSFINNQLKIYSISGRLENNYLIKGKKINISNLSKGVYFIEINDGTKLYYSKFVKQ